MKRRSARKIESRRRKFNAELKSGEVQRYNGKPVIENGKVKKLDKAEKAYRSGYNKGLSDSTAVTKTQAGLRADKPIPKDVALRTVAINKETGRQLTGQQLNKMFNED